MSQTIVDFEAGSRRSFRPAFTRRLRDWFAQDLDGDDWRLLGIALATAFLAGMTMVEFALDFPINVFAQPIQLLKLATPMHPEDSYSVLGIAFGCFVGAVLVVSQIGVHTGWKQKRGWLVGSTVLQALGTGIAAILRINHPTYTADALMLPEIALMATTGGIQIATMRILDGRVNKVNTIQFFGALVNMLIDKNLWRKRNANRNVRALFIGSVIAGGCMGVLTHNSGWQAGGSGLTFLVCAAFKGSVILGALLCIPGKRLANDSNGRSKMMFPTQGSLRKQAH